MGPLAKRGPLFAAAIVFAFHAIGNAHYGFFRDELYFIICGRHPQWGYVDQPPVVPLLAALTQIGGHSLFLLRLVPALFAAAGAATTVAFVAELGGGAFAQALATIVFLFCSVLMSFGMKVSTDEVGLFTWPLLAYLVLRVVNGADARLWFAIGAVAGISIESKYTALFFIAALGAGLLATPQRAIFRSRAFLGGAVLALAIALPNVLWQAHYGFPMWQLLEAGQHGKNVLASPPLYVLQEILITNLFLFPVWAIGVVWLLTKPAYRFLGYAYVVLILEMIVLHGKHYYPADVYPIVIGAGAVAIESWTHRRGVVRFAIVAYALVLGPLFVPFAMPVLPEPQFLSYQERIDAVFHLSSKALATEHGREQTLPGDWADMHGWPQLAQTVRRVYDDLPLVDHKQAVVFASNYGEASAIEFFAPGIPVVSGHNQYWLWGPRGFSGDVVIDVNGDCGGAAHAFARVTRVVTFSAPYARADETGIPIMLCRGIRAPLATFWPQLKNYS